MCIQHIELPAKEHAHSLLQVALKQSKSKMAEADAKLAAAEARARMISKKAASYAQLVGSVPNPRQSTSSLAAQQVRNSTAARSTQHTAHQRAAQNNL